MVAVHHVPHGPTDDLAEGLHVFLAEMPEDHGIDKRMVLIDLTFYQNQVEQPGDEILRFARSLPTTASRPLLLEAPGVASYCASLARLADHPDCLIWCNGQLLPGDDSRIVILTHGDFVQIALPPPLGRPTTFTVRELAASCTMGYGYALHEIEQYASAQSRLSLALAETIPPEPDDVTMLFQSSSSEPFDSAAACPEVSVVDPSWPSSAPRPVLRNMPLWIQQTFQQWWLAVHGPRTAGDPERWPSVITWYLDSVRVQRMDEARRLVLQPNYHRWLTDLANLWNELVDFGTPFQVYFVSPPPFGAPPEPVGYLILAQHPVPGLAATLLAIVDDAVDPWQSDLVALIVPTPLTSSQLLSRAGYGTHCLTATCTTETNAGPFTDHGPVHIRDGDALLLTAATASFQADAPSTHDADDTVLLQTRLGAAFNSIQKIVGPEPIDPAPTAVDPCYVATPPQSTAQDDSIVLHMHSVIVAFERIDNHFILPDLVPPADLPWPAGCVDWLDLPLWDATMPCDELCIYHDGAYHSDTGAAGFGVTSFLRSGTTWYFGGFVAGPLWSADSYVAELYGSFVATKLAHDILKIIMLHQSWAPRVWMGFDSMSVGQQAAGQWTCYKHPGLGTVIRSLRHLIEVRFHIEIEDYHIPAHRGEPGNEIADTLATAGAQAIIATPLGGLLTQPLHATFSQAMPWFWMLFDQQFAGLWRGHDLLFPRKPSTTPSLTILPQLEAPADQPPGLLDFVVCSCNVLTLKANQVETGQLGASRLSSILAQLDQLRCAVFGFQETRSRQSMACLRDDYILISGEATAQGHGGVLVGLSRRHPHGYLQTGGDPTPVYFSEDSYSVIASTSRFLVLRVQTAVLKAIVISAHAPHSGATLDDIQAWWTSLHQLLIPRYSTWPMLLMCDANARVGAHTSAQIGDHQAEPYNEKALPFMDFLAQMSTFLPSTFVDFHLGSAGTWKHPTAGWRRNDFIGLPLAWEYTTLESWVAIEVDASLHHEDHRAVCAHVCCAGNGAPLPRLLRQQKLVFDELKDVDCMELCLCYTAFLGNRCSYSLWSCATDLGPASHPSTETSVSA